MILLIGALEADLMTSFLLDVISSSGRPSVQPAWLLSLDHHHLLQTTCSQPTHLSLLYVVFVGELESKLVCGHK